MRILKTKTERGRHMSYIQRVFLKQNVTFKYWHTADRINKPRYAPSPNSCTLFVRIRDPLIKVVKLNLEFRYNYLAQLFYEKFPQHYITIYQGKRYKSVFGGTVGVYESGLCMHMSMNEFDLLKTLMLMTNGKVNPSYPMPVFNTWRTYTLMPKANDWIKSSVNISLGIDKELF